jgi:hypothetical protein
MRDEVIGEKDSFFRDTFQFAVFKHAAMARMRFTSSRRSRLSCSLEALKVVARLDGAFDRRC